MNDWENVRRHPVLWAFGTFAFGFLILGFGAYFARGATLYEACVFGTGCGLALALLTLSSAGIGGQRLALPPLRRITVFDTVVALVGLAIVVVGLATGNWKTALAGLPLVGFGVGVTLARHFVLRREDRRRSK